MHTMPDGTVMSDEQMGATDAPSASASTTGVQPSAVATMVCGDEIADAVERTYGLPSPPTGSSSWSPKTRLFVCRYPLAHSVLTLTVKDIDNRARGRNYFDELRHRLSATPIRGLENLGFPAFQNEQGQIGFLKDGKTLYVDGSGVTMADIPSGSNRTETAYGVAAAVIACWKE